MQNGGPLRNVVLLRSQLLLVHEHLVVHRLKVVHVLDCLQVHDLKAILALGGVRAAWNDSVMIYEIELVLIW